MSPFVLRRDHSSANGAARQPRGPHASLRGPGGFHERVARLVGSDRRVLIIGRETAAMARTFQARGCQTVAVEVVGRQWIPDLVPPDAETVAGRSGPFDAETAAGRSGPFEGGEGREDRRSEVVIVADLLGRIEDPRAALQALKEQIRPGGSLIITLTGITHVGGQPALFGDRLLGAESGLYFNYDSILALLEEAGYVIVHLERTELARIDLESNGAGTDGTDRPSPSEDHLLHDCLIVAYPLPVSGLDYLQQQMREMVQQRQDALRDVEELRRYADLADRRLEIIAGREKVLAERITDLRAQLLAAHAQMIERDDEIRKTFGEAIHLRNTLLVERDSLLGQRHTLLAQHEVLARERSDLLAQRDALVREQSDLLARYEELAQTLRSAEARLNIFRRSPLGRAYRAIRRLVARPGDIAG